MIEVEVRACWLISAPKRHLSRRTLITDLGSFCGIGKVTTLNPTAKRKKKKKRLLRNASTAPEECQQPHHTTSSCDVYCKYSAADWISHSVISHCLSRFYSLEVANERRPSGALPDSSANEARSVNEGCADLNVKQPLSVFFLPVMQVKTRNKYVHHIHNEC